MYLESSIVSSLLSEWFEGTTINEKIDGLKKYGSPTEVLSSALRGFIVPFPGHDFIGIDFDQIEARISAWISDEEKRLELFRQGKDLYVHSAMGICGCTEAEVDEKRRLYFGKVPELALGFQGGEGAFIQMSEGYGFSLPKERVKEIIKAWRDNNPNIVQTWYNLSNTAIAVVKDGISEWVPANPPMDNIAYRKAGSFLLCRLPSGGEMVYPYPTLFWTRTKTGQRRLALKYKGVDSTTKKWGEIKTYGGKLFENCVQAIARDLLAHCLLNLEEAGYMTVLHIHDEIVLEVAEGVSSVESVKIICEDAPGWSKGLPFGVKGWRGKRYKK